MFRANATSIPLFAGYFFGDVFRFGYLYRIFGYEVYLGEILLTVGAIALATLLCIKSKHAFVAVFERADMEMYERKKQLKEMGAIVRD